MMDIVGIVAMTAGIESAMPHYTGNPTTHTMTD